MDLRPYNVQHWNNIQKYSLTIQRQFLQLMDRLAQMYGNLNIQHPFDLNALPEFRALLNNELRNLANQINATIVNGMDIEWELSNRKNDVIVNRVMRGRPIPERLSGYMGRNLDALTAFKNRVSGGMGLSDRVWSTVAQELGIIEQHMALGIFEGKSAKALATDMKFALNDPDALFRRVRDASGELRLSKPAQAYEAGRGRYRSAYKNALRMTRTETNLAYQKADNERWDKLDFVLGVRVKRSGASHYDCDICDSAVGDYPKDYEWTALHPNCLCYAEPILASEADVLKSLEDPSFKYSGQVTDIPKSFENFQNRTGFEHFGH
jgi:hypothetical protein